MIGFFLKEKEEQRNWHKGIYNGIKIQNPKKLYDIAKANDMPFNEFEAQNKHYHDGAMILTYTIKMIGIGITTATQVIPMVL